VLVAEIDKMLEANEEWARRFPGSKPVQPARAVAIVACMDSRMPLFGLLGLDVGDAHVIRNAGGRVTDDVLRSLALSSHVLGVDTVVVMQHTRCGLAGVTDEELRALTGADLGFFPIDDHAAALREDVELLAGTPYLAPVRIVGGFVYDVESGRLDDVVRWERPVTT
jgi:carbonic anhydrase